MQVHHGEGVAIRIGPEPCVDSHEGVGEASAGEQPWWDWSVWRLGDAPDTARHGDAPSAQAAIKAAEAAASHWDDRTFVRRF